MEKTIRINDEKRVLFEKIDGLLGKNVDFAVMIYPEPSKVLYSRVLLKVLIDEHMQFTAEIDGKNLLFRGLFTEEMIAGNISMERIMHDAVPMRPGPLGNFFKPDAGSSYSVGRPVGTNCGKLTFINRCGNKVSLKIEDAAEGASNMSGTYEMEFSGWHTEDSKGRDAVVVFLRKQTVS